MTNSAAPAGASSGCRGGVVRSGCERNHLTTPWRSSDALRQPLCVDDDAIRGLPHSSILLAWVVSRAHTLGTEHSSASQLWGLHRDILLWRTFHDAGGPYEDSLARAPRHGRDRKSTRLN